MFGVDPETRKRPGLLEFVCEYSDGPEFTDDNAVQLMVMSGSRSQSVWPAVAQTQPVALVIVHCAMAPVRLETRTPIMKKERESDCIRG